MSASSPTPVELHFDVTGCISLPSMTGLSWNASRLSFPVMLGQLSCALLTSFFCSGVKLAQPVSMALVTMAKIHNISWRSVFIFIPFAVLMQ